MRKCVRTGENRNKYLDGCTVGLMIFEFNPTSQELCLLNSDSTVATIVRAKDQEIKELKKRVAELEEGYNDGEEKEWKNEEKKDEEDEEIDEERIDDEDEKKKEKGEEDEQKEKKIEEGQDDKKGEKEDGENEEGNEKESEKKEERKDGDDDEERDHDVDNEYNNMNEENQTKYRADVNFDEQDYEAVCTLSFIVNGVQNRDKLIEKRKLKDFDSPLSIMSTKRAKQKNE
ncbi:Protein-tyrosine-phosphatase [Handroanthus impetiginosus]|uniref:Protein-tyrosine-phosphatase n=1 Tax=Handroanthus impetiginosus TaxID=429701 RepID=A0A2G9HK07_9LAMI|nr:Protein-tyrosine-phosphatase [Handroanthus impetiginosus]